MSARRSIMLETANGVSVSLHKVSIVGVRSGRHARTIRLEAEAEIDTPSGDFVRGRFLNPERLLAPVRMQHLHLGIEGSNYGLVSIEESGAFIAVKEA